MAEELAEKTEVKQQESAQVDAAPEAEEAAQPETDQSEGTPQEEPVSNEDLTAEELAELRANEAVYSWQASEYVHHTKGPGWYWALVALLIILTGAAAFLHYWLEIVAFLAMGGAIVVYARKPPRTLTYELGPDGIKADDREFPYAGFRSFGVLSDEAWHTIDLEPVKRFSPRLAILFEDDDFETVVGHLGLHLPRVDRDPDVVEVLTRILRF